MERQALVGSSSFRNTYLATVSAFLYISAMGMVNSYSSPATVDMLRPGRRFRHITPDQITWIASLPNFSGAFGNLVSGYISHRLGRKAVLMGVSTSFVLSWLLVAYAPNVHVLYAGRTMSGFSAGVCVVAAPAYVVEIAPTHIRGFLSSGFQVAYTVGVLLVMSLGAALVWSWLAVAGGVLVALTACLMSFMPESPTWLIRKSRTEEALKGLRFLKGKDFDLKKELQCISSDLAEQREEGVSIKDVLDPTLYKPMLLAVALMFFQQFSGINPLMSYTVEIFQSAGSSVDPGTAAVAVAAVQVVGTGISSLRMDRSGRRRLFTVSAVFMALALFSLGLYSYLAKSSPRLYGWIPLASFVVYIFSYSLGVGPIPFVMTPEMATVRTRSTVLAVAAVCCSIFAFVVTKIYEDMKSAVGDYGLFWTYSLVSLAGAGFSYFVLPETKGLTINQIHRSFSIPNDSTN